MPARRPTRQATAAGVPIAHEPIAAASTPIEGGLVSVKAAMPKPGFATSEFWAALTAFVVMVLPTFHVTAAPPTVKAVMDAVAGVVVAAYALSRAIVKAAHEKHKTALPPVS